MKVYLGIDWSKEKHDLVILNEAGQIILRDQIAHTQEGFMQIEQARSKLGVSACECVVGIETAHNVLIDFLWDWEYQQVYVLPPNAVRSARGRFRQSGAHNDESDAWLIADLLRTDLGCFNLWYPDSPLTRQLRVHVRLVMSLSRQIVRHTNQLRAYLLRYYPAATEIFSSLDAQIALAFIQAYPNPQAAASLSLNEFRAFAKSHHYAHMRSLPRRFAQLQSAHPQPSSSTVTAYQQATLTLVDILLHLVQTRNAALRKVQQLYQQHPDYPIFHSLPGAGQILGPALLTKFGDDRRRFPKRSMVQALAGTCPVTESSGKRRRVRFRRACDHDFRHIVHQWARASIRYSDWADAYFQQVRLRSRHSIHHAYRCLANRWLAVLWKLWTSRTPYDEAYQLQQRAAHSKPVLNP